jgi:hypothetical protein
MVKRDPCYVHFYDEPRSAKMDAEGRREWPTRDLWCFRCKGLAPEAACPAGCESCKGCKGTGIDRVSCKAHCQACELPGGYCPLHYVPDPFEADRRYINEVRLGDPAQTATLKTDRRLVFLNGWWDGAAGATSCKPDLVRLLITRGRPSPVAVVTDTQLLDAKYTRSSDGRSFTDAVMKPAALIIRVGLWGGKAHEALPGVVVEAVRLRASQTTILVNEPITPWGKRHVAWSEPLEQLLEQRGARFTISTKETSTS